MKTDQLDQQDCPDLREQMARPDQPVGQDRPDRRALPVDHRDQRVLKDRQGQREQREQQAQRAIPGKRDQLGQQVIQDQLVKLGCKVQLDCPDYPVLRGQLGQRAKPARLGQLARPARLDHKATPDQLDQPGQRVMLDQLAGSDHQAQLAIPDKQGRLGQQVILDQLEQMEQQDRQDQQDQPAWRAERRNL